MAIGQLEKRKEPRIPVDLKGYLKRFTTSYLKRCTIKNLSLHGALILFDEPLKTNENIVVRIKDNGTSRESTGIVKWCHDDSSLYKIGVHFPAPINVRLPLKEVTFALQKTKNLFSSERYFITPPSSNIYLELIKNSTSQLHVGYLCFFLKNKIMALFQTINTEINFVDITTKKILKVNEECKIFNEDISSFYHQHFNNLNNELNKIKSFIKLLDRETNEAKNHKIAIIHIDEIVNSVIQNYYKNIPLFDEIELISNFSDGIRSFIGNKYLIEKAIKMIFIFHVNYILFYNANKIKVYLAYIESKKEMLLKIINNGSKMFNKDIEINKKKLTRNNYNNNFLNYLKFIIVILDEYDPNIKIINESGNNHFTLTFSIDPII